MTTPDRTANYTPKPKLLTVDDAKALDLPRMTELFTGHLNPGQLHFMKLLGFHKVKIERAEGMYYYDQNGRAILDFFGGFGSLAFGHNHPRILEARRKFQEEMRHEIAIAFSPTMSRGRPGVCTSPAEIMVVTPHGGRSRSTRTGSGAASSRPRRDARGCR